MKKRNVCQKGEPGYLRNRKIRLLLASCCGFLLVAAIFLAGYLITGSPKNYITVLAVLAVLPTAKVLTQYLVVPWNHRVSLEDYETLQALCSPLKLYCELLITGSEKNFEILYLIIDKKNHIIAFTENKKADPAKFQKAVVNFLNYYNWNVDAVLFTDRRQFEKRVKQLAALNAELSDAEREHIAEVFEKISIMSL